MKEIFEILNAYKNGTLNLQNAGKEIENLFCCDMGHTKIDFDRKRRTGVGEIVYGASKTPGQCLEICRKILARQKGVLITRATGETAELLQKNFENCVYEKSAKIVRVGENCPVNSLGEVAVITAGTSDIPVAREAELTLNFLGDCTKTYFDCGVAGLHRLLGCIDEIRKAKVVIAVAGMEGALASVLAGLVAVPVIAVPTSVGYGANFGGLSALLSMVNSCANGVSVVNIDNGFGAAYNAHLILRS